jgi:hypothetical protein
MKMSIRNLRNFADLVYVITVLSFLSVPTLAQGVDSTKPSTPAPTPPAPSTTIQPLKSISDIFEYQDGSVVDHGADGLATVGLDGYLAVKVDAQGPVDPSGYVLFIDGLATSGLDDAIYNDKEKVLVFHLQRNDKNSDVWSALLGAPRDFAVTALVSLGPKSPPCPVPAQCVVSHPTILGMAGGAVPFHLRIVSGLNLIVALIATVLVIALVWYGARSTALLRDNLLPQVELSKQPYSLGRWQMAFWFVLVFASYLFLYALLHDPNTLSQQALMLMGISGATALGAVAVDVARNTPVDDANTSLRALGLNSHGDVEQVRVEIEGIEKQLAAKPAPATTPALQAALVNRQTLLLKYEHTVRPFVSQGWYADMVNDINGAALHRLQVFCWTWVLGALFVIGVYNNLAMPQFSDTLLALMAVSSGGYVGFKCTETQQ